MPPSDFIKRQLRSIIGIEIKITSLQGTWKTSQNKKLEDNMSVSEGLNKELSDAAKTMAICVEETRR
jgi:transcriptional regulator